jgi:hypothetical protein
MAVVAVLIERVSWSPGPQFSAGMAEKSSDPMPNQPA